MASLSPATWIGVGLVVTAFAAFLPDLRFFLFIGIPFILFGVVKLVWKRNKVPGEDKDLYHKTSPRREERASKEGKKTCFVCSAINSAQANFCGHCGHRLR